MKSILAITMTLALTTAAQAQAPAVADPTVASWGVVQTLVAEAKAQRREGQPLVSLLLAQAPGYTARVDYRASVGPANLHETENEIFEVLEGSATLVVGGQLVEPTAARNGNRNGVRISGGQARAVGAGDVLFVAAGAPHWFSAVDKLVVLSIHTPPGGRPAP